MSTPTNRRRWLAQTGMGAAGILTGANLSAHPGTEPKSPLLVAALPAPGGTTRLSVSMHHPDGRSLRPGCIRIRSRGDTRWSPLHPLLNRNAGLSRRAQDLGWYVLTGLNEIEVPGGTLEYEAFSDINSGFLRGIIEPTKTKSLRLQPRNLFQPADTGMVPGNTHLHLRKMNREQVNRYLTEIPRADGLNIVFVSYLERALASHTYSSNEYSKADLEKLNRPSLRFGNGEEYRHNFDRGNEGYGHVMLLDIAQRILPASVGPGITLAGDDGTPLQPGIRLARESGATVIWCHNTFGHEDIPNWLAGYVDAQNIFDGGNRNSYAETYYRYLNLGLNVPFSTGTDWFMYDFSRTYAQLDPARARTPQEWLRVLKAGRSLITNGTWLELDVNEADPGDTMVYHRPLTIPIRARAVGRNNFGRVELIRNGTAVAGADAIATDGHFATSFEFSHELKEPEWWALRIAHPNSGRNELDQPLFAHTSPIYLDYQGKRVFDPGTARSLISEMAQSTKQIRRYGKFADEAGQRQVLGIYEKAIKQLRARF